MPRPYKAPKRSGFGFVTALATLVTLASWACSARPTSTPLVVQSAQSANPSGFWVRPGYRLTLVAEGISNARFLEFDDKGTLFVSRPNRGDILAFKKQGDKYVQLGTFIDGRRSVHGMCWSNGWLYFTQTGSIHRAKDTNGDGTADQIEVVIPEGSLPRGGGHWWRSILVTGDAIYTSIGDNGNITEDEAGLRERVWRFDLQGQNKTLWSSGLRNTEKLRLRPGTSEVWGVDHGSDWFGGPLGDKPGRQPITDLNPPDEFNHYISGGFYGHPFIVGNRVPRIEFQDRKDIIDLADKTIPPAWCFGAHWAANSFCFLTKNAFPNHQGDAFVACHGSWNSKARVGYRVERVLFDKVTGKPYGSLMIVNCLTPSAQILARPVDCVEAPDGSVLFSCDQTGKLYSISPEGK